ncbi:DUF952 domain-containing protein [Stakelama marina]|uniref:DUF952 domain-containing protein n=1 Tax=Stakelama marina TaxID=2826939 RepID=A0A8T4IAU4_9SPHN|nr:DUF952 domain-containing protein [Stakelama marina]MBR0551523.1 DUF952 domain-containing protein [Stakelama marina]
MTPEAAYKVLTDEQMQALEADRFEGAEIDKKDGYIHLSTADQLTETVDKHFEGQTDLWIAEVDLEVVGTQIRWEESRGGQKFPHLYGKLRLDTVIAYSPLERDEDGRVKLPVAG